MGILGVLLCAGSAQAQSTSLAPYFLIVFDTSSSMIAPPLDVANSCGFTPTNKLNAAKCALGHLLDATGEAQFGLMHFAQTFADDTCAPSACGPTSSAAMLRVPIATNTAPLIRSLIDNAGTPGAAAPDDELCAPDPLRTGAAYTPLGGSLRAAREYFEAGLGGFAAPTAADASVRCRPLAVIMLTDGVECCEGCVAAGDFATGCPKANTELAGAGLGSCSAACETVEDENLCSAGDAFETAPERAYELRTETMVPTPSGSLRKAVATYVVGLGISAPNPRIERIAVGGGTDNPADGPGGVRGFYASDEAALSAVLTQIIADAQPPAERCNGVDDDCDLAVDEGLPGGTPGSQPQPDALFCDGEAQRSAAQNRQVRARDDYADDLARSVPLDARVVCGRVRDDCDDPGVDDDCDGAIDEDGANACGGCGPLLERCNGDDDDCDGRIDEATSGERCGSAEGRCRPGETRCVGGEEQCVGAVEPRGELCNCEDDDCDGRIDEDVDPDAPLCAEGSCRGCRCTQPCGQTVEFSALCPEGQAADIAPDGACQCVADECDRSACAATVLNSDGAPRCAPDRPDLPACVCKAGQCAAPCDGVACAAHEACEPSSGRCVENNCRGLGCPAGELCEPGAAVCVADACAQADCSANEACRAGACEQSCADQRCASSQLCRAGRCIEDPCAEQACDTGEVCDPRQGQCVAEACRMSCPAGLVCLPGNSECQPDPCWNLHCPADQRCWLGECMDPASPPPSPTKPRSSVESVVATGGGGCTCRIAHTQRAGGSGPGALALIAGLVVAAARLRRRSRRRAALAAALGCAVALSFGGCTADGYCLDCPDEAPHTATERSPAVEPHSPPPDSLDEHAPMPDAGASVAAGAGAARPTCGRPEPEGCDGRDNDCDGAIDEDVAAETNPCDRAGVCAGTAPQCVRGEFVCRYPASRERSETRCDGLDNDCDGAVDESFDGLGRPCELGRGACRASGVQVCSRNGTGLRCELAQSAPEPSDEVCDGLDNDCDGVADEPRSAPGEHPSHVRDAVQQVRDGLWIYTYEAVRPDASAEGQGALGTRACSRPGMLPWTNVSFEEAAAACAAADMRLCSAQEWRAVCEGNAGCAHSYDRGGCAVYPEQPGDEGAGEACNGHDLMSVPGGADLDALAATGTHPNCFSATAGGAVFDLSGNVEEWTTGDAPGVHPLRGGSYEDLPAGLRCDFEVPAAGDAVRLPTIGFRCCSDAAP